MTKTIETFCEGAVALERADRVSTAGFDFLGNQFANASFDPESGEWGNPQFNSSWGNDVTQMMQQDFADMEQAAEKLKKKTSDSLAGVPGSEEYRRQFEAEQKRLGEEFEPGRFNAEFFSANPALDSALKERFLERAAKADPNAVSNFSSFEREYREGLQADKTPFTWEAMISAFESHEYSKDLVKKMYEPADGNGKTETAESSILDRFSSGISALLGALGISAVGLGLLNRTGAGTGGVKS